MLSYDNDMYVLYIAIVRHLNWRINQPIIATRITYINI
jgi:hypothetical protein